jgi:hypothetical protein
MHAGAITIREGFFGEFGETFASRTVLPAQTDEVQGSVAWEYQNEPPNLDDDYFSFADLLPGSPFTLTVEIIFSHPVGFEALDSQGNLLMPPFSHPGDGRDPPTVRTGIVPASGELVISAYAGEGENYYTLTLDAPRVVIPEPTTAALVILGLAALAGVRRVAA